MVRVDPDTNRVIATIPVGAFPVGIAAGFGSIWQASNSDGTLTRVNAATNKVIATIPAGPGPAQVAVASGMVWVADEDSTLVRVDPATNRRVQVVRVGQGNQFRALVGGGRSVWTDNSDGGISRVDAATGKILATIDIPGCCDGDLLFADGVLWVCNALDAQVYRIDPATNRVVGHFQVEAGARGIAIANGLLWLTHSDTSVVSWRSPDTGKKLGSVTLPGYVGNMAVTDPKSIWVQTLDRGAVIRLSTG